MREKKSEGAQGKKKQKRVAMIILVAVVFVIVCIVLYFNTKAGKEQAVNLASDYIYDHLEKEETIKQEAAVSNYDMKTTEENSKDVYNIALIGTQDGNSDTMIVATMDTLHSTLKLTSIMRDIYVEIPGHKSAKLNAAYQIGGVDLFYQTMEQNFQVSLDGYVAVDYDAFEYVVDEIGGVDITLTKKEASFLNGTNYISEKQYRTVVEGTQNLNGNQALGYCRIRDVATSDDEHYDFGRTSRQRNVLNAIYTKLKDKNVIELAMIMNDILSETSIKTDIPRDDFKLYLNQLVKMRNQKIQMDRVPWDGTFRNEERVIGSRNADVLIIRDWEETRAKLKKSLACE